MRIPEEKIEEVRAAADIVDVVSGFVRLRKAGRNYTGLCPFHREKTPSFNVNPERGIYKCFGCGKGGNAFTFLMEMEKVSFVDAVEMLAERYNIVLTREGPQRAESREDIEQLYEANRLAARFFYDTLQGERGEVGRAYFDTRGWNADTRRMFGLGFAPDAWHEFLNHARAAGIGDEVLERTGLIVRKEGGATYDRFRGRVIFPILSVSKKVLGFGARTLKGDEQPKYLNSPESPIYVKSRVLYGLAQSHRSIRDADAVILVEGYADLITLYQEGVRNVVATSGTALTPDQVNLLARYTRNFFFLYDADSAGMNAMLRGIDIILEADCDARIVQLPAGEDPDSYVRKYGADKVRARMADAVSFVDFVTARFQAEGKLDSPEGKAQVVHRIVELIAKMDDPIRREFYLRDISQKYGIYEQLLYQELAKELRASRRTRPAPRPAELIPVPHEDVDAVATDIVDEEFDFCRELLQAPSDLQAGALHHVRMSHFTDGRIRNLIRVLFEQEEHEGTIETNALWSFVEGDTTMHQLLADLLIDADAPSPHWETRQNVRPLDISRVLLDAYKRILIRHVQQRRERLKEALRAEADPDRQRTLTARVQQLRSLDQAIHRCDAFADLPEVEE
ncbi:MAG: DNA primase [Bacteroidota bacterium]|jgi:DNA primase|nr:DNA primase [Bacteroidota bacterium]